MALPPGPSYSPALQTFRYVTQPEKFLRDCHQRYGDIFTVTTLIFGPEVCVVRPEVIKTVFTGDSDELRAGEANIALEPLVGMKSVLLLDGAEHLRQRRLMMPPFHGERMFAYARTMREIAERMVDGWPVGKKFTLHKHMQKLTLEIILRTIFGVEEGAQMDDLGAAIARVLDLTASPFTMVGATPPFRKNLWGFSPWARLQRALRSADKLIYEVISRRRAEIEAKAPPRTDVLSMLLTARDDKGDGMTDAELRDELLTLLAAGHETTATELCWALDAILGAPRVVARLQDELRGATNDAGVLAMDRLPYLDATLKEALRLHPVIPAVARRVKVPMVVGGYDVPAGMLLVPGVWLTHHLPDIYPQPDEFRPERFLDTKPDPYAWLPFGGGVRRCLGMAFALFEMKVVLATVLTRVSLRLTSNKPTRAVLRGFTHAPRGNVPVIVEKR